jgi:hypothetical protein
MFLAQVLELPTRKLLSSYVTAIRDNPGQCDRRRNYAPCGASTKEGEEAKGGKGCNMH